MPEIKEMHFPNSYKDVEAIRKEYTKNKCVLVSLEKLKDPIEAKKLKDYLLGITWSKEGIAFQYKKLMLFSMNKEFDPKENIKLSNFVWREDA